MYNNIITGTWL